MADEKHRAARAVGTQLGEVGQLLHQVRPVVGDGVLRVVPEFLDGVDLEAAAAQAVEDDAVGARGKAVAVREHDGRHRHGRDRLQISFSSGVEILRSGLCRVAGIFSGCSVAESSHTGCSMLSNTSRSFWPQLLCIMR
ncbi:hypothetical protein D9M68_783270 [compost metagenome]